MRDSASRAEREQHQRDRDVADHPDRGQQRRPDLDAGQTDAQAGQVASTGGDCQA